MTDSDAAQWAGGLVEALHAAGPGGPYAAKLDLFGRFIGSWRLEWTAPAPTGNPRP